MTKFVRFRQGAPVTETTPPLWETYALCISVKLLGTHPVYVAGPNREVTEDDFAQAHNWLIQLQEMQRAKDVQITPQ